MVNTPETENELKGAPRPDKLRSPTRGAILSPKVDIEKARKYVPKEDQEDEQSKPESSSQDESHRKEDRRDSCD